MILPQVENDHIIYRNIIPAFSLSSFVEIWIGRTCATIILRLIPILIINLFNLTLDPVLVVPVSEDGICVSYSLAIESHISMTRTIGCVLSERIQTA